jgi:hypothetical protein
MTKLAIEWNGRRFPLENDAAETVEKTLIAAGYPIGDLWAENAELFDGEEFLGTIETESKDGVFGYRARIV